ncbi:MAG: hypothetical protein J5720_05165 [Bacteroidaceae bacterium]|nr:hypothetical protein [Bacteroidaceae bacterium]
MKKMLSCIAVLLCAFSVHAQTDFKEDFSSLPKAKYGANSAVTLSIPSGEWEALKMEIKENNGVKQFTFYSGSSSYLITPALDDPGKISVDWGSGGSNKLVISYSVNYGAWQQLAEISSGGSGAKSYSAKTGLDGKTNVRFRFVGSSTNTYVTKVAIKSANAAPVVPDDPTYITEGVWVPTKAFPTATKEIYIAPDGNDQTGDGSKENPWFNLGKAIDAATPGTHIICRGGTYNMKVQGDGKFTIRLRNSGTAEAPIVIRCYDGEKPVFDFVNGLTTERVGERGLTITGDYWWLFGLHITHAADNAIKLEGSHNRIERCEFSYNLDTGLQMGFGHKFSDTFPGISENDGTYCAYNDIIDCDSHHNCNYDSSYGDKAAGFACGYHNGVGNRFIRCRAWYNSNTSWDLFETDYDVVIAECWAWMAGDKSELLWVKDYITKHTSEQFSSSGNGFQLGGNGTGGNSRGIHYVFNSISFGHWQSSTATGFYSNGHTGGHVLVGCLAFDNNCDYMFESDGSDANTKFYNNVCLGKQEIYVGYDDYNAVPSPMSKNGWTNHVVTGISADNYVTLDKDDALLPRDINGGLPRKFGRPTADPENQLVDAGNADLDNVNGVWQQLVQDFPFLARTTTGTARDIGPYELPSNTATALSEVSGSARAKTLKVMQNGRLVIMKNGRRYNALGQTLR